MKRTLGGFVGYSFRSANQLPYRGILANFKLTVGECNVEFEETAFPDRLFLPRNAAFPCLQIEHSSLIFEWLSEETKRVVFTPLFAVLRLSVLQVP